MSIEPISTHSRSDEVSDCNCHLVKACLLFRREIVVDGYNVALGGVNACVTSSVLER